MSDAAQQEKYADKIAKLLAKAESTDSEAERDTFIAAAQRLMTTWAIDEAMLSAARGENAKTMEEIIQIDLEYTGIFQAVTFLLGFTIARPNDCRGVYFKRDYTKPKAHVVQLAGFESDVRRCEMLNSSLQVQCASALQAWWAKEDRSWYSKMQSFKERRTFIEHFIYGVADQLRAAADEGKKEAVKNEAARSGVSEEEASASVALVLKSRKERVDDWFDSKHGKLRSGRGRSHQSGSYGASNAGRAAGRSANVGRNGSVGGGSAGALGR